MKIKPPRFTFKKEPRETGLRSIGRPNPNVEIKLNKKKVGYIAAQSCHHEGWTIRVMVNVPSSENCSWSWRHLGTFEDEASARKWINENAAQLIAMNLRKDDDE